MPPMCSYIPIAMGRVCLLRALYFDRESLELVGRTVPRGLPCFSRLPDNPVFTQTHHSVLQVRPFSLASISHSNNMMKDAGAI